MTTMLTVQAIPATRVPVRALALLDALWAVGERIGLAWSSAGRTSEPKTSEEVMAWAHQVERNQPSFAADLRAAALANEAAVPGGR